MAKLIKRVPRNHMNLGGELMARISAPFRNVNGGFHAVELYTPDGWWDRLYLAGARKRPSRRLVKLTLLKCGITPEFW
jgi:hypothetical protein